MASQPVIGAPAAPSSLNLASLLPKPVDYGALLRTARAAAAQDVAQNVAGIRQQQSDLIAQASARAAEQGNAARATADFLRSLNLPGLTEQAFANSAAAERAAAQGYSGGLQQTVGDAAARMQQQLANVGAPGAVQNLGPAAGNVLYGLGGNLPASQLDVAGPLTAASLRALPAQALAYGQQQALGALGAGQQDAAKLNSQILAAQAQRSTLVSGYLKTLSDQARQSGNDQLAHALDVLKYQADQDAAKNLQDWRSAQLNKPTYFQGANGAEYVANPQTGKVMQITDAAPMKPITFGSAASGYYAIDPTTGQVQQIVKPTPTATATRPVSVAAGSSLVNPSTGKVIYTAPKKAATAKQLSGRSLITAHGDITDTVKFLHDGVPATTTAAAKPAQNFADALRYMRQHGYMDTPQLARLTLRALRDTYAPTEVGLATNRIAGPPVPSAIQGAVNAAAA